jgi:sulfite reductase (NADPH) flavoprotein alpha-component
MPFITKIINMKFPDNVMHSVLLKRQLLSGVEDERSVYLVVLSIPNENCTFEPGDIVFIYPQNNAIFVEKLLTLMQLSGEEPIVDADAKQTLTLHEALSSHFELLLKPSVFATLPSHDEVNFWMALTSLKNRYKTDFSASILCNWLKPMRPRAYSIASAHMKSPHTIELIVGLVTFKNVEGGIGEGLSSGFLCKRLRINESLKIYVKSSHFKLPADDTKPVIMVGPGTGIAPFKAFLEARLLSKATGHNWLFFGGRHRDIDFIFEDFITHCQRENVLTRLDLAFSRDQEHKVYVQHRMMENADVLWEWLQKGAYFYICGEAKSMAKDVESTLLKIIENCGHLNSTQAEDFLKMLKNTGRYQKDVY